MTNNAHRNVIIEIIDATRAGIEELRAHSRSFDKLPKVVAMRLAPLGYFCSSNTEAIRKAFHCSVDLVGWKSSFAQPFAVIFEHGFSDDRLLNLDEFNPRMRVPNANLLKLFIALQVPGGLKAGENVNDTYYYGLATGRPDEGRLDLEFAGATAGAPSSIKEPDPF